MVGTYVEDNKQSAIGMPYVVSWLDEENQIQRPVCHTMMKAMQFWKV